MYAFAFFGEGLAKAKYIPALLRTHKKCIPLPGRLWWRQGRTLPALPRRCQSIAQGIVGEAATIDRLGSLQPVEVSELAKTTNNN